MPEQPKSTLKVTIPILAIVVIGAVFFFVVMFNNKGEGETNIIPQPESQPVTQEETAPESIEVETPVPMVDPLDPTVEEKIQAIAAEVDAGTLTREEAQAKVNKLLGIE